MGKSYGINVPVVFALGFTGQTALAQGGQITETFDVAANVVIDTSVDDGGIPPSEIQNETIQSGAGHIAIDHWSINGDPAPVELLGFRID